MILSRREAIDFAISASVLKLMIQHDANVVERNRDRADHEAGRNESAEMRIEKRFREYVQDSRRNKS